VRAFHLAPLEHRAHPGRRKGAAPLAVCSSRAAGQVRARIGRLPLGRFGDSNESERCSSFGSTPAPAAGSTRATIGVDTRADTRDYRAHLDDVLTDDAEAVACLNAALAEDPEVFLLALRDLARTREGGLANLAEAAQLNREHLCRMLSENGNPDLRSLEALTPSGSASASS
jgi:DNA-binding phage protein